MEQLKKDVAKWQSSSAFIDEKKVNEESKEQADIVEPLNLTTKMTTETTATSKETGEDGVIRERSITSSVVAEIS